jgi:hypothetical protein
MKYYETHYEEYLSSIEKYNLHPELNEILNTLPNKIQQLENIIIYGPPGSGKYSQVLKILKKYSPSELKYEKKITVQTEKQEYIYKMSDIHFEIDMSILGCNSKLIWNEIFLQIVDIISVKQEKVGVILCKNFHLIHTELLEIFYSYMQQYNNIHSNIKIKFFLLTEHLSFIPNIIINCSHILRIQHPTKDQFIEYTKTFHNNYSQKGLINSIDSDSILNIKEIRSFPYIPNIINIPTDIFNTICDNIIKEILNPQAIEFASFRDLLYDILTYNLDMIECLWYILKYFIENNYLNEKDTTDILIRSYTFLKYYNNNYRPIYHLESIIFYMINKIHQYNEL